MLFEERPRGYVVEECCGKETKLLHKFNSLILKEIMWTVLGPVTSEVSLPK